MDQIKEKIAQRAEAAVRAYEKQEGIITRWKAPLVGYADAADGLFAQLTDTEKFSHPKQIFRQGKTVIAFFIPFDESVHESNTADGQTSAIWAAAYKESFLLCALVNDAIIEVLNERGRETSLTMTPRDWNPETFESPWSHRHAAFAAGLGTFGIHRGLITKAGCAGRLGSVITDLEMEPTPRPRTEYCLFKANGSCGLCMKNCPVGAIAADSLDKKACYAMCLKNEEIYEGADVCGKCMSGKPCSAQNPVQS